MFRREEMEKAGDSTMQSQDSVSLRRETLVQDPPSMASGSRRSFVLVTAFSR